MTNRARHWTWLLLSPYSMLWWTETDHRELAVVTEGWKNLTWSAWWHIIVKSASGLCSFTIVLKFRELILEIIGYKVYVSKGIESEYKSTLIYLSFSYVWHFWIACIWIFKPCISLYFCYFQKHMEHVSPLYKTNALQDQFNIQELSSNNPRTFVYIHSAYYIWLRSGDDGFAFLSCKIFLLLYRINSWCVFGEYLKWIRMTVAWLKKEIIIWTDVNLIFR